MNKCKHCNVFIDEGLLKCPLCQRIILGVKTSTGSRWYPSYNIAKIDTHKSFRSKVLLFLSITIISICLLINLLSGIEHPWILYIAGPVLYLFLLINNTILSKTHVGTKILIQILGISNMLFIIDYLSGYYRWSVNVVLPFLVIMGTLLITIIIIKKKMLWNEYIGYTITMIFLGFIPVVLYLIGIANILWPSAVSALYALLTTVGMLLFSKKKFKNELVRRFHF